MFKAPTLPWQKKWWNKSTFYLPLERYENENLDVLRDAGDSKRKKFSENFAFCHEHTVSISVLVYN